MEVTIIEVRTIADVAAELPSGGFNQALRSIRSKIGDYSNVFVGDRCGTVKDKNGKCFDWWYNDCGDLIMAPAR